MIAITENPAFSGPFTLIEGNRRAVAFARRNTITACSFYVGCSDRVAGCLLARHTYFNNSSAD